MVSKVFTEMLAVWVLNFIKSLCLLCIFHHERKCKTVICLISPVHCHCANWAPTLGRGLTLQDREIILKPNHRTSAKTDSGWDRKWVKGKTGLAKWNSSDVGTALCVSTHHPQTLQRETLENETWTLKREIRSAELAFWESPNKFLGIQESKDVSPLFTPKNTFLSVSPAPESEKLGLKSLSQTDPTVCWLVLWPPYCCSPSGLSIARS